MCVCVCFNVVHMHACLWVPVCRGQKWVAESLELELQVVMNCLAEGLGTDLRSPARIQSVFNY